ncbi:hypothetical protein NQZ68_033583 [Dissostichus eleginoides]|nr:hypothetical protein NQZ68_033583 [Dissostichus eleginoides]
MELSTEELLQKLEESGIKVTEEEAQRFREMRQGGDCLLDSFFLLSPEIFRPNLITKKLVRSHPEIDIGSFVFSMKQ